MSTLRNLMIATLLANASNAMAASSVDLAVKGTITPSACTPSLSNGGIYDIGKLSAKDLKVETFTRLEKHTMQLSVTCDAPTLIALEGLDNRAGSEFDEDGGYGLGFINGTEKLGVMSATLVAAMADGVAARTIISWKGSDWQLGDWFYSGYRASVADSTTVAPMPVQRWTADLILAPIINATKNLTLNDEVPIDGSVTVTVRYL